MKRRVPSVLLSMLVLCVFYTEAVCDEPVIHPQHPRMFFRKDDLSWIRQRCATTHRFWYRRMKSWLDAQAELGGGSGVEHAMLYQITGDERYAKAALRATELTPEPGVYDLLYETTDADTRRRYAMRLLPNVSKWWGANAPYFFTSANARKCLAIYGDGVVDAEQAKIVARVLSDAPACFDRYAERTKVPGGWMSSFHCGCFVRNLIEVYQNWTVATGDNRFVDSYVWPAHATWMAHHLIPGRWTLVPLSSAWWGEGKTLDRAALPEVAHFARDGMTQHFINNFRKYATWEYAPNPGQFGYYDRIDPKGTGLGYWHSGMHNVYRMILFYDPEMPERPLSSLPLTAFYPTWGRACMRTNWNDDAIFSVFKCGWYMGGEPPDLDDGNFAIYHKGNLVLDNSWNFKKVSRQSVNQNTITVLDPDEKIKLANGRQINRAFASVLNDGGQSFYDPKQTGPFDRGKVIAFEDNPHYLYVAGDATKSYHPNKMKEFTRQYVYVKPNVFIIFDRVESTKADFEKRFVMHTRTKPELTGDVLRADASELLFARPELRVIFPYKYGNFVRDSVPGFHQPQYENFKTDWQTIWRKGDEPFYSVIASKVPNRKVTLKFECRFGGEEIHIVHNTAPQYGAVNWSLDGGKQKGTFSQHAPAPGYQQKKLIVRDLAKGEHTLTLVAPRALMNIEIFEVKLGGRMFVKTLLPKDAKINVVEGYPESEAYQPRDRYNYKRRWRLEVRPPKPAKRDVFCHVIQVGDLRTAKMSSTKLIEQGDRSGVEFELDGRRHRFLFNSTGDVGGHVTITGRGVNVDRNLTGKINPLRDEALEASYAKAKAVKYYDYETKELSDLAPGADVAKLRKALKSEKWYVRYHAGRMLGMKRAKEAEKELIAALGDKDSRVVASSAEALGRLKSVAAVQPLVRKLTSEDAAVRFNAAWAIGRMSAAPGAFEALRMRLADTDPFVVYAAADAIGRLGRIDDAPTVAALVKVIETKDHLARAKAAETLGMLRAADAVRPLRKLVGEGEAGERLAALYALGKIGGPDAIAFLMTFVATNGQGAIDRLAAARALARKTGDNTGLRAILSTGDARVRQAAVFELARRGDKAGIDLLVKDLMSADRSTRQGAAWALYRIGDKRGLHTFARDLLKKDWGTRSNAAVHLSYVTGVIGDKRPAVKAMVDVLAEHVGTLEKLDTLPSGAFEPLYRITRQLQNTTGQKFFNWRRFQKTKKARGDLRNRWLNWWKDNARTLPEVNAKQTEG